MRVWNSSAPEKGCS